MDKGGDKIKPVSTDHLVRVFSGECCMLWQSLKEQTAVDGNINVPVFRLRFVEITKLSSI